MIARRPLLLLAGIVAAALVTTFYVGPPDDDAPLAIDPASEAVARTATQDDPLAEVTLVDESDSTARVEAAPPEASPVADGDPEPTSAPPPTVRLRTVLWTGDSLGIPIGGVAVECQVDSLPANFWMELGRTDEQGLLEIPLFEAGRYRFGVDEHSVPEGLLPPGDYPATGVERVPGLVLPTAELAAGESAEITLWLMEARSVSGRVVDASGAPAAGALVRVDTLETRVRVKARSNGAPVGDDGAFVIEGLYPGEYVLSLGGKSWGRGQGPQPAWFADTDLPSGFRDPPRLYLDLRDRSLTDVALCVTPGNLAISGRLIDAEGLPIGGREVRVESTHLANGAPDSRFDVRAYQKRGIAAMTTSDADGVFRIERLDRRPLALVVLGVKVPKLDGGAWWFGEPTALFAFDPSTDPDDSIDVGDVVVPSVPVYRASGTVVLDESHPDAGGLVRGELVLDLHFGPREDLRAMTPSTQPQREFDPNTGEFQYACITPREVATLWLYPSGQGGRGKAIQLYPKAGVVESGLVLTYP